MGQNLEKPITVKESECGAAPGGLHIAWASSCMQGWRLGMEDAHITVPSLSLPGKGQSLPSAAWTAGWRGVGLFAVFDGHGGEHVAKYVERHFAEELCTHPVAFDGEGRNKDDIAAALRGTFHRMDELLFDTASCMPELASLANTPHPRAAAGSLGGHPHPDHVGCTACVCCVTERHIIVANAGDSRAVLCRNGKAVPLSFDHKPNSPTERRRIEASGGKVEPSGPGQFRVNGNLNLSRALGDLTYKKHAGLRPEEQTICATPDVIIEERSPDDEFVVICCDGVWDMLENQQVVTFVRQRLPLVRDAGASVDPEQMKKVMEDLLDKCLSRDLKQTGGYGGDNMTAVVFRLPQVLPYRVKVQHDDSGRGGTVAVDVSLPAAGGGAAAAAAADDVVLRVSEATACLHVGAAGGTADPSCVTRLISLREHLPEGAVLGPAGGPNGLEAARFDSKARELRVNLPWHRC